MNLNDFATRAFMAFLVLQAALPFLCADEIPKTTISWSFPEGQGVRSESADGRYTLQLGYPDPNTTTKPQWENDTPAGNGFSLRFDKNDLATTQADEEILKIFTSPFTITAWVKILADQDSDMSSVSLLSIWYDANKLFSFGLTDLNKGRELDGLRPTLTFRTNDGDSPALYGSRNQIVQPYEWCFVAVSYDGSEARFWVNATASTCKDIVDRGRLPDPARFSSANLRFGLNITSTEVSPIMISDVRIFDRSLQPEEIMSILDAQ